MQQVATAGKANGAGCRTGFTGFQVDEPSHGFLAALARGAEVRCTRRDVDLDSCVAS